MSKLPPYHLKKTDDLIPYVNNSRTHSEPQVNQIASSIKEFGFTNPVLIDEDEGVIAGHGRIMAAKKLKLDEVPCIVLNGLTEAQKKAYVIADNKLALNAGWDFEMLTNDLNRLQELDFDLALLGFGQAELETLLGEPIDMSILDELDDDEVESFEENVRKAIQIEFEADDYDEAQELIKHLRDSGGYVGGIIIDTLRRERNR